MGSLSIQKGKRAEREMANILNPILVKLVKEIGCDPVALKRNLAQSQQGGFDLEGLPWIAIEIKHHKAVSISSWWAQTLRQAGPRVDTPFSYDREPVLIWKQHGGQWKVRMIGRLFIETGRSLYSVVDISLEAFLVWFEKRAEVELRKAAEAALFGGQAPGLFG